MNSWKNLCDIAWKALFLSQCVNAWKRKIICVNALNDFHAWCVKSITFMREFVKTLFFLRDFVKWPISNPIFFRYCVKNQILLPLRECVKSGGPHAFSILIKNKIKNMGVQIGVIYLFLYKKEPTHIGGIKMVIYRF